MSVNPKSHRQAACLLAILAPVFWVLSCADDDSDRLPPNAAFLGIVANHRDAAGTDPNLAETYRTISQGEFGCAQFGIEWGEIEPYPGARRWHETEKHGYQARIRGISLSTEVILFDNVSAGALPEDLAGRGWADPTLRVRLAMFLRDLDRHLAPGNACFWLGREADAYFAGHRGELAAFIGLLGDVRDSLLAWEIDTPVGVSISYNESLAENRLDLADSLAPHVDLLGLSIYGRDLAYSQTLAPQETIDLVREAVRRFPVSQIVITGTGYPGDLESGVLQEEFIQLLTGYLSSPPDNLAGAVWFCLHDWHSSLAQAEAGRRHGGEPEAAAAYASQLETLGIRQVNGVPRPAWYVAQAYNRAVVMSAVAARKQIMR